MIIVVARGSIQLRDSESSERISFTVVPFAELARNPQIQREKCVAHLKNAGLASH